MAVVYRRVTGGCSSRVAKCGFPRRFPCFAANFAPDDISSRDSLIMKKKRGKGKGKRKIIRGLKDARDVPRLEMRAAFILAAYSIRIEITWIFNFKF